MELYVKYGFVLITNAVTNRITWCLPTLVKYVSFSVYYIKRRHLNLLAFSLKTLILILMERVPLNVPNEGGKKVLECEMNVFSLYYFFAVRMVSCCTISCASDNLCHMNKISGR